MTPALLILMAALPTAASSAPGTPGRWTVIPDNGPVSINMSLTSLADGRVLMAGGGDGSPASNFAQTFSPTTNSWTTVAPMHQFRDQDTATLLPDGTVLAVGGTSDGINPNPIGPAEVFDPKTDTWTQVGALKQPRFDQMAILLKTGKVLVCGGTPDVADNLSSCELYDPSTRSFTSTGDMGVGRRYSALVTLADGDVMTDGDGVGAEIYVVSAGRWHTVAKPPYYNSGTTLTLLKNGTVMETPSVDGDQTEFYDPVKNTWTLGGTFNATTYNTANTLPNGTVLSTGGCTLDCSQQNVSNSYIFLPAAGRWVAAAPLHTGREDAAAVTMVDGRVMVVGGFGPPEVFQP